MDAYDSDSSLEDVASTISTNVLLGYATEKSTDDTLSRLGGKPEWIDPSSPPSFSLAQCKTCNGALSLLLQLNGELPDRFPGHERQLYIWACRNKGCRKRPGSVRAIRATRATNVAKDQPVSAAPTGNPVEAPKQGLGSAIFGSSGSTLQSGTNPFSANPFSSASQTGGANPFKANPFTTSGSGTAGLGTKSPQKPTVQHDLSATFAQKARLSDSTAPTKENPSIPWPTEPAKLAKPFPQFQLDAEYEYLSSEPAPAPTTTQAAFLDKDEFDGAGPSGSGGKKDDDKLYEDAHDKAFQKFADVLSQNPDQVLRYEFGGTPLLYSRTDSVGELLVGPSGGRARGIPPCQYCGAARVFEVQLTPQAIVELESEDGTADVLGEGMEWGAIIMGVCSSDCFGGNGSEGKIVYRDEWCGVQWEEVVERRHT